MAEKETNTRDKARVPDKHQYAIPAEPLGTGACPTVSPGSDTYQHVKKHTVTPAEIAEATGTKL